MTKWFEVTVATREVIVVEVADDECEDLAIEAAFDECSFTFSANREVEKIEALNTAEEINRAIRHADENRGG
jgi:hypothetical protein